MKRYALQERIEIIRIHYRMVNKNRARRSRTAEYIAAVAESVEENLGLRYREMTNDFLWLNLDSIDLDNFYFQQDGATYHRSNERLIF